MSQFFRKYVHFDLKEEKKFRPCTKPQSVNDPCKDQETVFTLCREKLIFTPKNNQNIVTSFPSLHVFHLRKKLHKNPFKINNFLKQILWQIRPIWYFCFERIKNSSQKWFKWSKIVAQTLTLHEESEKNRRYSGTLDSMFLLIFTLNQSHFFFIFYYKMKSCLKIKKEM